MAITSLPTPPSRSDPENFAERADAFMAALPRFADEANALQQDVTQSAEDADNDARAAALSANAAEENRADAASAANAAASSQQGAAQKAAESSDSAALARQWATKLNEPVDAGEFSAKHYAQLAAQGMGLPVFPLAGIPSTNVGPIFVPTQGPMEWVASRSRYEVSQPAHGQCRFVYVSPTECRLMPHNGNGLIINGRQYWIPAAGLPVTTASTTAATAYYFYAKDDGAGGWAVEARAAGSNPHSRHTDGVEILTGNPNYTLVGWALTSVSNQFLWSSVDRRVMSWFNRRKVYAREVGGPSTTASPDHVQLTTGLVVCCWAGELISFKATGIVTAASGANQGAYLQIRVGFPAALAYGGYGYTLGATGAQYATAVSDESPADVDGVYAVYPMGLMSGTGSITFRQNLAATVEI